jgi:hypothetical protein
MRRWVGAGLGIAWLAVAGPGEAQQATRCETDAMGGTFCARMPGGSAVVSGLGQIVCAPGQCVQDPRGTEWQCSAREGGWARWDSQGPRCEEGCTPPSPAQCRKE